jgi:hypothetical protein
VSKEQLKHVAVVIQGSNMARRPAPLISFVNARIGSQENVDDIFPSEASCVDERWRTILTRQAHVNINQITLNKRLDNW